MQKYKFFAFTKKLLNFDTSCQQNNLETLGEILRKLREKNNLSLRKVAESTSIDIAILSKMERGERKLSKDIVLKLANLYNYDSEELLVLLLSEKILYEIQDEELGEKALKVAEKKINYLKENKSDGYKEINK